MVENGKILRYLKFLHGLNPGRTILVVPQNHLTVGTESLVKRGCGVFAIARLDKRRRATPYFFSTSWYLIRVT